MSFESTCGKVGSVSSPLYDQINERKLLLAKTSDDSVKQIFGMRRSTFLLSLYIVFYVVYLITGGLVFTVLEGPVEEEVKQELIRVRTDFLKENNCVQDSALEDLLEKIVIASGKGVTAVRNASGEPNWSFGQSLFFSSTVVTTIGYGHVTPITKLGKCFCIIYAILGIPLTLMLLTALVERLMVPSKLFLDYLNASLGHLSHSFKIRFLHFCIIGSIFLTLFWFLPAAIFAYLEPDWDFLDSMYYCFISLTTIGLGDYIPGDSPKQPHRPLYKVLVTGYLLIGLTSLVFVLAVFYEIPQLNFGVIFLMESDETTRSNVSSEKSSLHSQNVTIGLKYTGESGKTDQQSSVSPIRSQWNDSSSQNAASTP